MLWFHVFPRQKLRLMQGVEVMPIEVKSVHATTVISLLDTKAVVSKYYI